MEWILGHIFFVISIYHTVTGESLLDCMFHSALMKFVIYQGANPEFLIFSNKKHLKVEVNYFYMSREQPMKVKFDNTSLDLINSELSVKFIVHGWAENTTKSYITDISSSYLSIRDYNIIQVDWSNVAFESYLNAAYLSKNVAEIIGELILQMYVQKSVPLHNIHIIGHSLGAHIAGLIGKRIQSLLIGMRIGRITALDPAGPYFTNLPRKKRLTENDADIVDVTHTDGGYLGYYEPCGTADFYINGGVAPQPGCSMNLLATLFNFPEALFCSHKRSYHYYNYSIRIHNLEATKCDSYKNYMNKRCSGNEKVVYGEKTTSEAQGIYYFNTNAAPPYKNV